MKKLFILLCTVFVMQSTACSSKPVTEDGVQEDEVRKEAGTEQNDDGQTESTEQTAELKQYENTVPVVYMTKEITAESLGNLYRSLDEKIQGEHTAVKISAGELPSGNAVEPELFRDLVTSVKGTIVACGTRDDLQPADNEGLAQIAEPEVLDESGSVAIPVEDGLHLEENYVGAHFSDYDGLLMISYFQGHAAAGFDGAVKNISVGISSAEGKCLIYSAGGSSTDPRGAEQDTFLESMAEAGKAVADALHNNILYINIMDHRSIDGGFDETTAISDDRKIGILASADPVALDQACVDLVYMEEDNERFVDWMEKLNGEYVLEYAEEIGLGSSAYTLVSVD